METITCKPRFAFPSLKSVSRIAFGAARFGAFWQRLSLGEQLRTLDEGLHQGVNVIDTADVYTRGISERLVGRAVKRRRDNVILCTKVGQIKTPWAALAAARVEPTQASSHLRSIVPSRTPADTNLVPRCFHSAYIGPAVESSLRRLRTDSIDILLLHSPTAADIVGCSYGDAIESLSRTGKIKHFGISCDDPAVAAAALDLGFLSFLEIPVNALDDRFVATTALARQRGVGVLARSPFDGGRLIRVAGRRAGGCTEEAIAALLRTVTDRPEIFSTILGANTVTQMRRNLAASRHPLIEDTRRQIIEEIRQLAGEGKA